MFENLTERLTRAFKNLTGQGRFSEDNIESALQDVRTSLLEADVALPVVKNLTANIKEKCLGQEFDLHLNASQAFVKIVHDELVRILGEQREGLNFKTKPPAVFLLAGLQGAGKTTTAGKLALYLKEKEKKRVMLASLDVYRPAAIEQLRHLAEQTEVVFFASDASQKPLDIANAALDSARKQLIDVILFDTAGRLHIDDAMMAEIKTLHAALSPVETLFVVDSMTGQDAANTAKAFHDALPLTGVILTKTDGDARGGAALSVKSITGKPIKFFAFGEKMAAFDVFHPDRMASRILGMGDALSLIEELEQKADKAASEKLAKKLQKGKGFDLDDFKQQLLALNQMGGMSSMLSKLPGIGQLPMKAMPDSGTSDKMVARTIAIINSMTPLERRMPKVIAGSRKRRIIEGSGTTVQDLNRLLKQYEQMQKMMKKMMNPEGMKKMMRGLAGMPGLQNIFPQKRRKE